MAEGGEVLLNPGLEEDLRQVLVELSLDDESFLECFHYIYGLRFGDMIASAIPCIIDCSGFWRVEGVTHGFEQLLKLLLDHEIYAVDVLVEQVEDVPPLEFCGESRDHAAEYRAPLLK